jgi:hypothetical protein
MEKFHQRDAVHLTGLITRGIATCYATVLAPESDAVHDAQTMHYGFEAPYLYGNQVFQRRAMPVETRNFKVAGAMPLHESCYEQHREWYAKFDAFSNDVKKISQGLNSTLIRSKSWQDARDMLPDYLINLVDSDAELRQMGRTRPSLADKEHRSAHWDFSVCNVYDRVDRYINFYLGFQLL